MKKKEIVNGSSVRTPGDNRHNFAQVPAMARPIPPPLRNMLPQQEEAGKQIKTDHELDDTRPGLNDITE